MRLPLFLLLGLLLLAGCYRLPPTLVPVCAEHYDVTCRAPGNKSRDMNWETVHACPWPPVLRSGRSCYVHAGVCDSRQVYRYERFQ